MNPRRFFALFVVGSTLAIRTNCAAATESPPAPAASDLATTWQKLIQIEQGIHYFETNNIISNRGAIRTFPDSEGFLLYSGADLYDQYWPESLEKEHDQLIANLRALGAQRDALIALLTDADAKVRTLALGALFEREDGRDLPAIASLVGDHAVTWPRFNQVETGQGGGPGLTAAPLSQTVGEVAQAMLADYFRAANLDPNSYSAPNPSDGSPRQPLDNSVPFTTAFAKYWAGRENRTECASWFIVKMERASRQITPIEAGYRDDIPQVVADINALPQPERALTMLYVFNEGWWVRDEDRLTPEGNILVALKQLGPVDTLRFLQRQRLADDPDLQFGDYAHETNQLFGSMANLILRNAVALLPPTAADVLLACEQAERTKLPVRDREVSPWWAAAAAELTAPTDPAHSSEILHAALGRFPPGAGEIGQEEAQSVLIEALWKIRGAAESDFIVNWFYDSLARATDVRNGPTSLLRLAHAENADPKDLLGALVADQRFEHTDWEVLRQMIEVANGTLGVVLVDQREIYDHQPRSNAADQAATLAAWRNDLRKQFDVPEKMAPVAAQPQKILTAPDRTIALTTPAAQLAISPDGEWLAVLGAAQTRPAAQIINTVTGNTVWAVPAPANAAWWQVVFTANPAEVLLINSRSMASMGNIATQNLTPRSGRFSSGVTGVFNRAATRLLVANNNVLADHDLADGKVLWQVADHFFGAPSIALAPDDILAAAGGGAQSEKVVTLYDGVKGTKLREITDFDAKVCAMGFAGDAHTLVTATAGNGVQVWDATTGKLEREFVYPVKEIQFGTRHSPMALSPDGRWVAVIGLPARPMPADNDEYPVGIFDLATGELRWEIRSIAGAAIMVFSSDSRTLYTAGPTIQVWKLEP